MIDLSHIMLYFQTVKREYSNTTALIQSKHK